MQCNSNIKRPHDLIIRTAFLLHITSISEFEITFDEVFCIDHQTSSSFLVPFCKLSVLFLMKTFFLSQTFLFFVRDRKEILNKRDTKLLLKCLLFRCFSTFGIIYEIRKPAYLFLRSCIFFSSPLFFTQFWRFIFMSKQFRSQNTLKDRNAA